MKVFLLSILLISSIFSKDITFTSKTSKTNIIELYTSQGCHSCPPADKWLTKLKNHPKLFDDFIPMAFHITYWDFIGWKDIFGTKSNDNRQRYYATKVWKNKSVYTPQFVIDAKEYRKWFHDQSFPKFKKEYGGNLEVKVNKNHIEISYFNKKIKNKKLYLNVALLGFDYKIDIKAGENKYKTLHHDFVVLEHNIQFANIKNNSLKMSAKIQKEIQDNKKYAIAIWLSDYNTNILQATGGYIKNN